MSGDGSLDVGLNGGIDIGGWGRGGSQEGFRYCGADCGVQVGGGGRGLCLGYAGGEGYDQDKESNYQSGVVHHDGLYLRRGFRCRTMNQKEETRG